MTAIFHSKGSSLNSRSVMSALATAMIIFFGPTGKSAFAEDLDIPAAQARYDQQRAESDQAKRVFDQEDAVHNNLQAQLNEAERREARAEQSLDNARSSLLRIERDITQTESEISRLEIDLDQLSRQRDDASRDLSLLRRRADDLSNQRDELQRDVRRLERRLDELRDSPRSGAWTCCSVDRGWEEHSRGHCATNSDRTAAQEAAQSQCLAVHAACEQSRCEQPDDPEIERVRRQLENAQNDLRDAENRLASAQQSINEQERRIRDTDYRISQAERAITQARSSMNQLRSDRLSAQSLISTEERTLSRAQSDSRDAQFILDRHTPTLEAARREWQQQESEAHTAYNYLQRVIANYNAALNQVLANAERAAAQHSNQEALERAPGIAESTGQRDAQTAGDAKGSAEGGARDFARGYKAGRESASSNPRLAASYQQGRKIGEATADEKAHKEDFPVAYNNEWDQIMAKAPENNVAIDITNQTSTDPGDTGADLDPRKKPVGNVPSPGFSFPQEPAYGLPVAGTPSHSTPAADFRYRSYPCTGLQLPEFEPKCRGHYDLTYSRQFASQFGSFFRQAYTASFNGSVKTYYDAALARAYDQSRATGEEQGGKDQGTLDGFAASLPQARARQTQLGQAAVRNLLTTGHLLIVREVKLVEESGDGLFASGDRAKLKITLDNYGQKSAPLGKLRVRITGKTNADVLTFEIRDLPALAANTRTTLIGAVAAKISRAKAQSKIALQGIIEQKVSDGTYTELEPISPEAEIRFPLEMQALTLSKKPKVGEEVAARVKLTNNTNEALGPKELFLASDPATVTFRGLPGATPDVGPGESVELDVNVKPGVWVTDDIPVNVLSTTRDQGGGAESTQIFPQIINVDRSAVLALKDQSGQPVPSGVLDAVAGKTLYFKVQFKYLANTALPGPFIVKYTQSSDPGIRPTNNSTTGVNYGNWNPRRTAEPINFGFDIPQSLRGKSGYIMIQLNEGSVATHALQIGLRVK